MAQDNLSAPAEPVATTAPTEDELIGDITDLLDTDPETDPAAPEKAKTDEAANETEDDDPLGLAAEDVEEEAAEEADGPQAEIKGGRFAPDSAKVKLDDGTVISVADLKRNNLFQRDYTGKTTALSEERKAFEAERAEFSQQAQSLNQFRDYAAWYAETHLPKQPTPPTDADDYVGWHKYRQEVDAYNAHLQAWQAFQQHKQQEDAGKKAETDKQTAERHQREAQALLKAMPVLRDPVKGKQVWAALVAGAQQHYGMSEEEINGITDHRILVGLRDALAYRRLKDKAPQVQAQVAQRPVGTGKRQAPQAADIKARQARTERLRQSGTLDDAAAAIADLL